MSNGDGQGSTSPAPATAPAEGRTAPAGGRTTPEATGDATAAGHAFSYILPLRSERPLTGNTEFDDYLAGVSRICELIIIDGSPPPVFAAHHYAWSAAALHVPPDPARLTLNGKIGAVLTGVSRASHPYVVVADDDVRFGPELATLVALLDHATVVRPQNYFAPLPWHAAWDSGRILLNRLAGGDWPGTLALHRDALIEAGGYAGDVLFENFELVRTLRASGGTELVAYDLFVRRLPPTASHFFSQRVRQAYDELSRPVRLVPFLAVVPLVMLLALRRSWHRLAMGTAVTSVTVAAAAEAGRRKAGGRQYFPLRCSLFAPLWVCERSVCSWLALWARARGGVRYGGARLRKAASARSGLAGG